MSDMLKGGLKIFIWLGINWIIIDGIENPISDSAAYLIPISTFVVTILIVNVIDKSLSFSKSKSSAPYPENWNILRGKVLKRDGYRCGNCDSTTNLHVHHVVPLSKGGANKLSNLKTLCKDCHKKLHPHMN